MTDAPIPQAKKRKLKTLFTPERKQMFLDAYKETFNASLAAAYAGVSVRVIYRHRDSDKEFARNFELARGHALDMVIGSAFEGAVRGWPREPLMYNGKQVKDENGNLMWKRQFDSNMVKLLLSSHLPEIYRERAEIAAKAEFGDVNVVDIARRLAFLLAEKKKQEQANPPQPETPKAEEPRETIH